MSFDISFGLVCLGLVWSALVNLNMFHISIEWFGTLKPISGWMDGMDGWDGWDGWMVISV